MTTLADSQAVHWANFGGWPGDDVLEAGATLLGLADQGGQGRAVFPWLPQRGLGSQLLDRGVALLSKSGALNVELMPYGWRLVHGGSGIDAIRAQDLLQTDLDDFAISALGFSGDLWVTVPGPMLAWANLYLPNGELAVSDAGARNDLTQGLAHSLSEFAYSVNQRVPLAKVHFIWDESAVVGVLEGRLETASGYNVHRPVSANIVTETWQRFNQALIASGVGESVLWCGAPAAPVAFLRQVQQVANLGALGFNLANFAGTLAFDPLAESLDAKVPLWLGCIDEPAQAGQPVDNARVQLAARAVLDPLRKVGLDLEVLKLITVTPRQIAVQANPVAARETLQLAAAVADSLEETRVR